MAPLLLDKHDLLKLAVVSAFGIIIAFSAGYYFGLKQTSLKGSDYPTSEKLASDKKTVYNQSNELVTSQQVNILNNLTDSEIIDSEVDVSDIDAPEIANSVIDQPVLSSQKSSTEKKYDLSEKNKTIKAIKNESIIEKTVNKESKTSSEASLDKYIKVNESVITETSKEEKPIKFSIQVAVYGDLKNAQNMMQKLQKKNLDAYVSRYTAKSGKQRFNVRLGYFQKRKAALNSLNDYIKKHKGDGYLVNFSAEKIVSFAEESATMNDNSLK